MMITEINDFKLKIMESLLLEHKNTHKTLFIMKDKLPKIMITESNDFKLKIIEILLVSCDKLFLNKAESSLPLEIFLYNHIG